MTDGSASYAAVSVLLVDNQTVVREGLAALMSQVGDISVVGQAADPEEAGVLGVAPDVIVAEIDRVGTPGLGVETRLRALFPSSGLVVLTNVDHPARVQAALDGGVDGYLLKTSTSAELVVGIRTVATGASYLQPSLGMELARWHGLRQVLSRKEVEVLALLAVGHTNAEVAENLRISSRTVESRRARLSEKLGRRTRAELFDYARSVGLVDPY
jgi:two-component system response regulator NreC